MMTPEEKAKQAVLVRGIAAAMQAMNTPTFMSLSDLLMLHGYKLVKIESTNKQTERKDETS